MQAEAGTRFATLSWQPPAGATSFNVFVSSARNCDISKYTSGPDGAMLPNVTSPRIVTGLRNGQAYFFKVESVFGTGERSVSNEAGARPNVLALNGPIKAIQVATDGTAYVGGSFSQVGVATGSAAPFDLVTGRPTSADFPIVDGRVSAIVADRTGGWYIGGKFTTVGAFRAPISRTWTRRASSIPTSIRNPTVQWARWSSPETPSMPAALSRLSPARRAIALRPSRCRSER